MINPKTDVYYKEKSACNEFIEYLQDSGFGDVPAGAMVKALAVVWSKAREN